MHKTEQLHLGRPIQISADVRMANNHGEPKQVRNSKPRSSEQGLRREHKQPQRKKARRQKTPLYHPLFSFTILFRTARVRLLTSRAPWRRARVRPRLIMPFPFSLTGKRNEKRNQERSISTR